jgi:long-chain acyl-CoA synthetase
MTICLVPHCAGEVLERALHEQPTREALVAVDRRFTYEELDEEIERAAAAIGALGIGAGDVVAASLPNASDVVVTFHAVMRLGAVWLGVNRNLAPPEKRYALRDAGAKLVLADAEVAGALARPPVPSDPAVVVVSGDGQVEWRERLGEYPGSYRRIRRDPTDLAAIAYTSGTTGRPKGVLHSHRNVLLPGAVLASARKFGPELRKGDCASLTILNMQVTSTLLVAQAGGTQIVMDHSGPAGVAEWIRSEKVNAWFGVPTVLQGLARSEEVAAEDLASLSDVWTGGTYLPSRVRAEFEARFGRRPHATYGLTEVPAIATIEDRDEPPCEGSSGRALPHLVVEVRDDDGNVLPAAQVGTITVRAAASGPWAGIYRPMLRYLGNEAATSDVLWDDMLVTGDVGFLDDSGRLFVTDRRNALILRGGANVYPAEVERVLLLVPGVKGAAVVGVADERLGQRVAAAVELHPGARVDEAALAQFCAGELARYKVPERWAFTELPRNAMGKVVRDEVEDWFRSP